MKICSLTSHTCLKQMAEFATHTFRSAAFEMLPGRPLTQVGEWSSSKKTVGGWIPLWSTCLSALEEDTEPQMSQVPLVSGCVCVCEC